MQLQKAERNQAVIKLALQDLRVLGKPTVHCSWLMDWLATGIRWQLLTLKITRLTCIHILVISMF